MVGLVKSCIYPLVHPLPQLTVSSSPLPICVTFRGLPPSVATVPRHPLSTCLFPVMNPIPLYIFIEQHIIVAEQVIPLFTEDSGVSPLPTSARPASICRYGYPSFTILFLPPFSVSCQYFAQRMSQEVVSHMPQVQWFIGVGEEYSII